jgi:hypothetical protein
MIDNLGLIKYHNNMYRTFKRVEIECPGYYNKGNVNNCFFRIESSYGLVKTGYEKRFCFTFLHPKGFGWPQIDRYNGHARFFFGCGLFTISFDWGY